jgi:hypothetical protein
MGGGIIFHVQTYNKSPLICKRFLHYGHTARLCKNKSPNCKQCGGTHEENNCSVRQTENHTPSCFHCKGDHTGDSLLCPKYQEQNILIQRNPFPNLNNRRSIKPSKNTPKANNKSLSVIPLRNRFEALTQTEEDYESDTRLEEMEWDNDGDPSSSLLQGSQHNQPKTNNKNNQTFSEVLKNPSQQVRTPTRTSKSFRKQHMSFSRTSTEISIKGLDANSDLSPSALIRYVMDRQETQINNVLAVQATTIQNLVEKQNQALKESISYIPNAIPTIVTKVIESILPTRIQEVKTTLAQDNSDNSSDNL